MAADFGLTMLIFAAVARLAGAAAGERQCNRADDEAHQEERQEYAEMADRALPLLSRPSLSAFFTASGSTPYFLRRGPTPGVLG